MQNNVPVISYCSSAPPLSKTGKYFFRDYPSDAFQGKFAADYAYNTLGAKKIAILYHISDYGTGIKEVFAKRFTELGGQVVLEEGTPQDARDYKTQLSKINAANPDYIYAPMFPDGATVMVDQYKSLGLKAKIFASDSWDDTKLQVAIKGKAEVLYTVPKTAESAEFSSKLIAKYPDSKVTTCVPQAYDAVKVYAEAVKSAEGTDPDKIQAALRDLNYSGVSGKIDFDENGDVTVANYIIKRIQNGSSVEVK
jgi:branched-chain amino acid transport system substrate-binding protein